MDADTLGLSLENYNFLMGLSGLFFGVAWSLATIHIFAYIGRK